MSEIIDPEETAERDAAAENEELEAENNRRLQLLQADMQGLGIAIDQNLINSARLMSYLERILLTMGQLNQARLEVSHKISDTIDQTEIQIRQIKLQATGMPQGGIDLSAMRNARANGANRQMRRHPDPA